MITPAVCLCGRPVGDVYDLYLLRVSRLPAGAPHGAVLDGLGIRHECCRTTMLTQVDYYNRLYGRKV